MPLPRSEQLFYLVEDGFLALLMITQTSTARQLSKLISKIVLMAQTPMAELRLPPPTTNILIVKKPDSGAKEKAQVDDLGSNHPKITTLELFQSSEIINRRHG